MPTQPGISAAISKSQTHPAVAGTQLNSAPLTFRAFVLRGRKGNLANCFCFTLSQLCERVGQ